MGSEHSQLKAAAAAIDARLKGRDHSGTTSRDFRTLIHGDFKSANLLFTQESKPVCAAYDFQYVGASSFDVARMLGSDAKSYKCVKHANSHVTDAMQGVCAPWAHAHISPAGMDSCD